MEFLISLYERWLEIPRWQKWLIISAVGAVIFALLYYVRIVPLQDTLEAEKRKMESLSLVVNRLKTIERRKLDLEKTIRKLERRIEQIEAELPSGREDVSRIIKSISDADSGVQVVSILRGAPAEKKYYVEIPYSLKLKATYPEFISWCEKLSKANRILNFGDISLKAIEVSLDKEDKTSDSERYTTLVELQIKAFNLKR
jgi:type IV pilus assembly protein PilO